VPGCCEYGDEPAGSGATELVAYFLCLSVVGYLLLVNTVNTRNRTELN
jgi:hypothetical protein